MPRSAPSTSPAPNKAAAQLRKKRTSRRETPLIVPPLGTGSMCTPEVRDQIIQAVKSGAYPQTAAQRAGVQPRTFREWMARGRDQEEPFAGFLEDIEKAIAEDEYRNVLIVSAAAKHDPRHAQWLLERRHPDKYGRSDRVEFDGSMDSRSVAVSVQASTADTSAGFIAEVVKIAMGVAHRDHLDKETKVIEMPAPSPRAVQAEDADA